MERYFFVIITGLSAGSLVAAGVFALITSTGLMTRMAGKTNTGKHIRLYEDMVILGGIWWNVFWVFSLHLPLNHFWKIVVAIFMGICQGVFVGCLAVSLAEALNGTAIFSRRIKLKLGLSFVILSAAVGKIAASLIQFYHGWGK